MLRDHLNEFELDWAQAPVRSGLIADVKWKNAKILLHGAQPQLQKAIAWSFMAWNDKKKLDIRVIQAGVSDGRFTEEQTCTEESFAPEEADYVILTGFCCREIPASFDQIRSELNRFRTALAAAQKTKAKRILLLSDGRIYGTLPVGFAASEYERVSDCADSVSDAGRASCFLQTLESIFVSWARAEHKSYDILRTGLLYGPCIPMLVHPAYELAKKTADGEAFSVEMSPLRTSYLCIHDFLTAIQFVLCNCPENKILNVSGLDSDQSAAELAMKLYQNFPDQCKVTLAPGDTKQADEKKFQPGTLLNTQLIEHYGFQPSISMEDGLIILVKQLQNTGEVFIFDNTYLGKLETVQQILLGYLLEIDRICKKHKIKYFLAGGTLLGAIRHHGFIPWDDDADVMMLREDYDHFLEVVQQELPENIFMQLPFTEKGNHNPFTKLRINNTMFATEFTGHFMDLHNGIFFDVLSHDQTGNHKWSQKLHLMITMLTRSVVFNKWGNTDIKGGGKHPVICKIVDKAKYLVPMRFAEWAQNKSLTFFKDRKTDYLYDGMGRNLKRGAFPKAWLEEAVYVEFEGYQFPVPKEYDKYLTYLYGDYMQMIPVSERRTSHSIVLTDLGEYADYEVTQERK